MIQCHYNLHRVCFLHTLFQHDSTMFILQRCMRGNTMSILQRCMRGKKTPTMHCFHDHVLSTSNMKLMQNKRDATVIKNLISEQDRLKMMLTISIFRIKLFYNTSITSQISQQYSEFYKGLVLVCQNHNFILYRHTHFNGDRII